MNFLCIIVILLLSLLVVVAVIIATGGSRRSLRRCLRSSAQSFSSLSLVVAVTRRRCHSSPPSVVAGVGSLSSRSMSPPSLLPPSLSLQPRFCCRCYYSSLLLLLHLQSLLQSVVGVAVVIGSCGAVIREQKPFVAEKEKVRMCHVDTSTTKFDLNFLYKGQHIEFLVIRVSFGVFSMTDNSIS